MTMSGVRHYTVHGMTCSHWVMSVREEVSEADDAWTTALRLRDAGSYRLFAYVSQEVR